MTPKFKSEFAEILDLDEGMVSLDLALDDDIWDSLAVISTAALIDEEYNRIIDGQALTNCKSVKELMALIASA
jgi:acyl carrier protein